VSNERGKRFIVDGQQSIVHSMFVDYGLWSTLFAGSYNCVTRHFEERQKITIFNKTFRAMKTEDILRNNIIDKLLTITNKDYLSALYQLIKTSAVDKDKVKLTKEQILMLQLSDKDIKNGKLISQSQLDKADLQWLKGL
jgi:hypothetical protein